MELEIPDQVELILKTTSDNFVKVISEKLVTTGIVLFPTKKIFMGTIKGSSFKLYRLKKFSWFDYNATEFKGKINEEGETTKLTVEFSLIWLYRHIMLVSILLFVLIDYLIIVQDKMEFSALPIFLLVEGLALTQIWFQNKIRFSKDKQRYIEIIKSLFETV
jgi:hypothetical protein